MGFMKLKDSAGPANQRDNLQTITTHLCSSVFICGSAVMGSALGDSKQ